MSDEERGNFVVRLLIAHSSELFTELLVRRLSGELEIRVCHDGCHAMELLQSFEPDALILDLHLPRKDGLTLLRQVTALPAVILGTTGYCSFDMQRTAYALGVRRLLLMPSAGHLIGSLMTLLEHTQDPLRKPDIRDQVRQCLKNLNFSPHLDGCKQLTVALPLFAEDPGQGLSMELYPAVAKIMEAGSIGIRRSGGGISRRVPAAPLPNVSSAVWRRC